METLIVLWIKWDGRLKIKQKGFIDVVSFMPCENSLWIIGSSEEVRFLKALATIDPLAQDPG